MAGIKEIRTKIKSVQNTRKITKAMEMVAASKMRKAQDRMRAGRPYATRVRAIAAHLMQANPDYTHPYMVERAKLSAVGIVLVTTDKGLCGGLNTNISRLVLAKIKDFESQGIRVQATALGSKGLGLLSRVGVNVVSSEVQLGDAPNLERLIGAIKAQIDDFSNAKVDAVYLATSRFVNTMHQEPTFVRLLPLPSDLEDPFQSDAQPVEELETTYGWDYLYEPDSKTVIDDLLLRYVEGLIYQSVAENMASEQSARMVAMKSASDNAKKVIGDLQLVYNKTRQAAITKEISEIVGGAAAV
ncbi:MAG: F0F1 ATP synthase subunit gamma [Castellaniella sp.]|uniref:F0F1 ATP synthase subunit gamma n=1 Tax=Castellaniella sp. TaxID=1955812 RepID=UPI0012029A83|nr:F0F1 ATP synthase subunit gamma [Castellaniella sp.]TAN27320.1 MAG: F0F1 ATP synthase subunit gamma [Castellaniella sp.]